MADSTYIQSLKEGIKTIFVKNFDFRDKFNIQENSENSYIKQAEDFLDIKLKPKEDLHLNNIFEQIYTGSASKSFHLKPLDLGEKTFEPKNNVEGKIEDIQKEFQTEYDKIPKDSLETLFFLLKKYLSFVPVNQEHNYINAFEFLKLRSAFAQSLHDFEEADANEKKDEKLPFLMLCIDISGIQGFIYNIASGKAAKSLKGRSFYLQLLMDSLIQRVIKDTQKANIGHIIYASGGKAYLLLPNLESVKDAIGKLEKEVEKKIYAEHKESLYVLMDFVEFGYDNENKVTSGKENNEKIIAKKETELKSLKESIEELKVKVTKAQKENDTSCKVSVWERKIESSQKKVEKLKTELDNEEILIADLWIELGDKTAKKKYRKYQDLLTKDFNKFFDSNKEDGFDTSNNKENNKVVCAVTGEVIENPQRNTNLLKETEDGEKIWVTAKVKEQSDLGKELKHINSIISFSNIQKREVIEKSINPADLGIYFYPKPKGRDKQSLISDFAFDDSFSIRKINSEEFKGLEQQILEFLPNGFTFYGGNKQALKANGEEKDYEELTGLGNEEDKGKGFRRLGILRMDVDGLGGLFADEMKNNNLQNFPAYAMVSAHLENFFAGYLNTIRNQSKYENDVNILYSGGDDVFAVGRWDLVLEFAKEIQEKFKAFVGDNTLTLSAGVAMIGGKFPISKGADLAGEAESDAKKFISKDHFCQEKNAISLFGEVVSWREFEYIKEIRDDLIKFDKDEKGKTLISSGFRQKLITFQATKNKHLKFKDFEEYKKQNPDLSYKWHSAYFIARLAKELKSKNKEAHDVLLTFKEDLQEPETAYKNRLGKKGLKYDKESLQKFLAEMQKDLFVADRNFDLYAIASRWASLILRTEKNK